MKQVIQGVTLYDRPELAKLLGISERCAHIYTKTGLLPGVRIGRKWWVSEQSVTAFLHSVQNPPKEKGK